MGIPVMPSLAGGLRLAPRAAVGSMCLLGALSGAAAPAAAQVSFTGLGFLPGHTTSTARGVSGDGSVVTGTSGAGDSRRAFRWTRTEGLHELPLPSGYTLSHGSDVSGDGSTIVGGFGTGQSAFRWTAAGGTQPILSLSGAPSQIYTSWDGSTVASGYVVWNATTGAQSILPHLSGMTGGSSSNIAGLTADGAPVAGMYVYDQPEPPREEYVLDLPNGPARFGDAQLTVTGLSPDGRGVLVLGGVWRVETGEVVTVGPPGVSNVGYYPLASSFDVSVVVGGSVRDGSVYRAFLWTPGGGPPQDLRTLLIDAGLDLTGWTLTTAWKISADGRTIVGEGINPQGQTEGWIATIPSPGAAGLLALWGLLASRRRRRSTSAVGV